MLIGVFFFFYHFGKHWDLKKLNIPIQIIIWCIIAAKSQELSKLRKAPLPPCGQKEWRWRAPLQAKYTERVTIKTTITQGQIVRCLSDFYQNSAYRCHFQHITSRTQLWPSISFYSFSSSKLDSFIIGYKICFRFQS